MEQSVGIKNEKQLKEYLSKEVRTPGTIGNFELSIVEEFIEEAVECLSSITAFKLTHDNPSIKTGYTYTEMSNYTLTYENGNLKGKLEIRPIPAHIQIVNIE